MDRKANFFVTKILTLLTLTALTMAARAKTPPNIVFILADDLGYGDVSAYGAKRIATPNIDRLASEGIRFTGGYSSASTCTPTRYSFLTGTNALRTKGTGIAPPNSPCIIDPAIPTIATLFKQKEYATAVIGKWHLGLGKGQPDWNNELKPGPLELGFDYAFLMPTTNDRVPQVFVENHRVKNLDPKDPLWVGDEKPSPDHPTGITHRDTLKMDWSVGHNGTIHNGVSRIGFYTGGEQARFRDEDLADEWVKTAGQWITSHKEQPFFLYLATHNIHVPRIAHERFQGKSPMGPRGDVILEFDWIVGKIVNIIDSLGLAENTLIVLTSDNGPYIDDGYKDQAAELLGDHRPAGPFRGGKYSTYEGGTRMPFIARWKNHIKPGVSEECISTIDMAASFASLIDAELPANSFLDSQDLSSVLTGQPGAKGRSFVLQQNNEANSLGLRKGDWKLVHINTRKSPDTWELYNLKEDIGESNNLADKNPEKMEKMKQLLTKILESEETRSLLIPES